jgi:hypothetical protein
MTFNLQRFTVHVDTIIAQLAHSIPLSDSRRTSILTEAEERYVLSRVNIIMKTRDIEDFRGRQHIATHYANAIYASREEVAPIPLNVDNDIDNEILQGTVPLAVPRAANVTFATDTSTDSSTFPAVEFLDTDNATLPPSIPEDEDEHEEDQKPAALVLDATSVESNSDATTSYTNFASPTFASAPASTFDDLSEIEQPSPSDNRKTAPSSTIPAQNSDWYETSSEHSSDSYRSLLQRPLLRLPSQLLTPWTTNLSLVPTRVLHRRPLLKRLLSLFSLKWVNFVVPIKLFSLLIKLTLPDKQRVIKP